MQPLLSQIQAVMEKHISHPTTSATEPLSDTVRLMLLHALLPLCPQIPHSASGQTLERWQILAYIASIDLTLVKWLESHLDALSILSELGYSDSYQQQPTKLWAVWGAEGHPTPVQFIPDTEAILTNSTIQGKCQGKCQGVKTWCSGANVVDFGLMTYRDEQNQSQLVIIDMKQHAHRIRIDSHTWQAVGMQATDTATVTFSHTPALAIGKPNAYLTRAGFWHGAGGVASCWYGATAEIADYLRQAYQHKPHPFKAMYLGQISSQLAMTQQYFYHVANLIDTIPTVRHELVIRQLRQQVEVTARMVLDHVGQALGATPFCQNAHFARLSADLSVFIRQTHGAFDAQAIGEQVASVVNTEGSLWQL